MYEFYIIKTISKELCALFEEVNLSDYLYEDTPPLLYIFRLAYSGEKLDEKTKEKILNALNRYVEMQLFLFHKTSYFESSKNVTPEWIIKSNYMDFLLHLDEDFDDDLLSDAMKLLTNE